MSQQRIDSLRQRASVRKEKTARLTPVGSNKWGSGSGVLQGLKNEHDPIRVLIRVQMNTASGCWQTTCAVKVNHVLRCGNMHPTLNRWWAGLSGCCVKIAACAGMYSSPHKSLLVIMLDSPERCIEWQEMPKLAPAEEAGLAPVRVFAVPGSR